MAYVVLKETVTSGGVFKVGDHFINTDSIDASLTDMNRLTVSTNPLQIVLL